jgi:general secretion pathway protein D
MKLSIISASPARGAPREISFDKDRLQFLEVIEGDFFRQGGVATSIGKSSNGRDVEVSVGVLRAQASGATGHGAALILRFKAPAAGSAKVRLARASTIGLGAPAPAPVLPPPLIQEVR